MSKENAIPLDFRKENALVTKAVIESAVSQEEFVFDQIRNACARVGVGGYLENRKLYQRGSIFSNDADPRSIHFGIDLWIEAGTYVFAPLDGTVLSPKNTIPMDSFRKYMPLDRIDEFGVNLVFVFFESFFLMNAFHDFPALSVLRMIPW